MKSQRKKPKEGKALKVISLKCRQSMKASPRSMRKKNKRYLVRYEGFHEQI